RNFLFRTAIWLLLCAAISFLTCPAGAQPPQVRRGAPPEQWRWVIDEPIAGMTHIVLRSPSMNRDVGCNVCLPASYAEAPMRRYPVVYYLHGATGSELSAYELGDVVRRLQRDKTIGEVIYVFPNGGHFSRYRDWEDGIVKAETYVIRELIPHIDKTYRTIDTRQGRALCGWSMGGDAALRFAFKYPEMFGAAATMAAAIDWGTERDDTDTIFAHAVANAGKIRGQTGLLMVVGEDDRLFAAHQRLLPHLDELKIACEFQSHPGVGHNLGTIKEKSGEAIVKMLARHYAAAQDSPSHPAA